MKLRIIATTIAAVAAGLGITACSEAVDDPFFAAPILGLSDQPMVISSVPTAGAIGVAETEIVSLRFNKSMSPSKCPPAFSIGPASSSSLSSGVDGFGSVFNDFFTFLPENGFTRGSFRMTMTTNCEDTEGRDLREDFTAEFLVGTTTPGQGNLAVQAVGVASQACSAFPGIGSPTGGDHTLGSCWWDRNQLILSPSFYTLRPGDDGSGSCTDVNTDNLVLIFNRYMEPTSTVAAVSLARTSPPVTTIRLSSWSWNDCQTQSPYGCRALTLIFAEDLGSCGGTTAFGTADFNLAQDTSGGGFPFYTLQVDTTATDVDGNSLRTTFSFNFEAE